MSCAVSVNVCENCLCIRWEEAAVAVAEAEAAAAASVTKATVKVKRKGNYKSNKVCKSKVYYYFAGIQLLHTYVCAYIPNGRGHNSPRDITLPRCRCRCTPPP